MGNDYHMSYTPEYSPNYTVMSQPFQPRVNPTSNNKYQLRFNNGYIFDYNDFETLKEPIKVEIAEGAGQEETVVIKGVETKNRYFLLDEGTKTTYYVLLTIFRHNGKIDKAEIHQGDIPDVAPAGIEKFSASDDSKPGTQTNILNAVNYEKTELTVRVPIKLAVFDGPFLEEIYLRENIHLNLLAVRALGYSDVNEEAPAGTFPIVLPSVGDFVEKGNGFIPNGNFGYANGSLSIAGIGLITTEGASNDLLIEYDEQNGIIRFGVDVNAAVSSDGHDH